MHQVDPWLRDVLLRPRATAVLIACLTALGLVTSALAFLVAGSPATVVPGSGSQSPHTADVTVTLSDNRIEASQAPCMPGTPSHFTAMNHGAINHELMLMPHVMGPMMGLRSMDQLDRMARAQTGDLAPGATKTVDDTFPSALSGHQMGLGCYYPGHSASGLHLPIRGSW
jgi:uncharacterized cupredoxin-like copper-binding protein